MSQCPQCGAHVGVDRPFCGNCGAALMTPQAPAAGNEDATQIRPAGSTGPQSGSHSGQQPGAPTGGQHVASQPGQQQWTPQPPPQQQYGAPQGQPQYGAPQGQQQYGAPQGQPQQQYGAPQGQPQYGAPQGQPQYGAPQGQPQQQYGAPQGHGARPQFDFSKLLVGNWVGAAMVAGAALGVALIGGALFAFTTMEEFDFAGALGMALMLAVSTFGSNVIGDLSTDDVDATASIGQYPLLVTVVALGVAVWLFRRTTANYRNWLDALLDAVRAALILMLGVLVLAIVVRIWSPDATGYSGGEGAGLDLGPAGLGLAEAEKSYNSIAGAIFLTFLVTLTVLAIAVFVRRDWLPAKAQQVNDWLRMPMLGVAAVAATSAVAGLIYLIAIIVGNDDSRDFGQIMRLLAVLPALGLRFVSLGVFAPSGSVAKSDGDKEESLDRLPDFADDNGFLFWIAPVVALAVMVAGVYAIVWKSLDKTKILRHTLVYLGLLVVALPFMVRFSNAHLTSKQEVDDDSQKFTLWLGVEGFQTTAFFILFSLLVAAAVLFFTGNLDVNSLKGKAQAMSNQFQQQPGQQQWGGQPPQQGGQWGQTGPQGGQQQWGNQQPQQAPPQQWGAPPQGGQPGPQQGWQQPPTGGQPPYGQPPQGGQPGGWNPGQ